MSTSDSGNKKNLSFSVYHPPKRAKKHENHPSTQPRHFQIENFFRIWNFFVDIFLNQNYNFIMKSLSGNQPWFNLTGQTVESATCQNGQEVVISMLLNSIHYYLDCAFIIHSAHEFRLAVFHRNNVLLDKRYTTLKGAKIAFHKIYRHQVCIEGVEARWEEYIPESSWIEKKMAILERNQTHQGIKVKVQEVTNGNLSAIS
jgi:hypothetical protein